jgi:hypothetical protein
MYPPGMDGLAVVPWMVVVPVVTLKGTADRY